MQNVPGVVIRFGDILIGEKAHFESPLIMFLGEEGISFVIFVFEKTKVAIIIVPHFSLLFAAQRSRYVQLKWYPRWQ
jgi:hypothetical protein